MTTTYAARLSLFPTAWSVALLLNACQGPLPPENPKTSPDQRADLIPILVEPSAGPESSPPSPAPDDSVVWQGVGLATPESVVHVPDLDLYLVSNIDGSPTGSDGNGFISQLRPDGGVENLKWIAGGSDGATLNAPKGMALAEGKLWVTDIDHIRRFDVANRTLEASIAVAGATFLNDVAIAGNGTVYVSDSGLTVGDEGLEPTGTDALYRIQNDEPVVVSKTTELSRPNGVVANAERLWVAPFGAGQLRAYDTAGKQLGSVDVPGKSLDGLVRLADDDFLISSWETATVYRGGFDRGFVVVVDGVASPADIGYDAKRQRVLIPSFEKDEVRAVAVAAAPSSSDVAVSGAP